MSGSSWWKPILDGELHVVDFRETSYQNLLALRSAAYAMANVHTCNVVTHKIDMHRLAIKAWGGEQHDSSGHPNLPLMLKRRQEAERQAAQLEADLAREAALLPDCTCASTPHVPSCAVWG